MTEEYNPIEYGISHEEDFILASVTSNNNAILALCIVLCENKTIDKKQLNMLHDAICKPFVARKGKGDNPLIATVLANIDDMMAEANSRL